MKALRCDRCGGYYRPDEEKRETIFIPRVTWRNSGSVKEAKVTRSCEEIDLCATCAGYFEAFMMGAPIVPGSDDAYSGKFTNKRTCEGDLE